MVLEAAAQVWIGKEIADVSVGARAVVYSTAAAVVGTDAAEQIDRSLVVVWECSCTQLVAISGAVVLRSSL